MEGVVHCFQQRVAVTVKQDSLLPFKAVIKASAIVGDETVRATGHRGISFFFVY